MYKRGFVLWLTVLLLLVTVMPVLGQTISITVTPAWSAATTLTSLDTNGPAFPNHEAGDDYRYVSVGLFATTNVEFWALQVTCTVPVATLQSYTADPDNLLTPDDWGDWRRMIDPGPDWGTEGFDYVMISTPFNPTTGAMTLTISRQGQTTPLGANGQSRNMLLATFSYRVKPQVGVFKGTAAFACTPIAFLSRNATPIGVPTFTAPTPLSISSGLSISGIAQYQARTDHTGIGVICMDQASQTHIFSTRTSNTGAWTISNIRVQDWYDCRYFGQLIDNELAPATPVHEADVYLPVQVSVNLHFNFNHKVLPVTLPLGNATRDNTADPFADEEIDETDISAVTSSFGLSYPATTNFGLGDVNNDKAVNRSDLVLVAGNFGLGNWNTWSEHVIVSAQRGPSAAFADNRIWVNSSVNQGQGNTPLRQLIPGANRDYWPALSPDGTKLAFTRAVVTGTGASARLYYQVFVQSADGTGTATRISPLPGNSWSYDALAPSWSPDGTRLVFIASWTDGVVQTNSVYDYRQSRTNSGDIYVVDATGRNVRQVSYGAKVYPPSWLDNETIVFGGASWNSDCGGTICRSWVNSTWSGQQILDATDLPQMSYPEFADMPNIRNGRLYYRYQSTLGDTRLRVANLDWDNMWNGDAVEAYNADPMAADSANTVGLYHIDLEWDTSYGGETYEPLSTYVDYYAIRNNDGGGILYYEYQWDGFNYNNSPWDVYGTVDRWDGSYGNALTFNEPARSYLIEVWGSAWWNGEDPEFNPSDVFPLRTTFFLAP
jgi:hypothetical protein